MADYRNAVAFHPPDLKAAVIRAPPGLAGNGLKAALAGDPARLDDYSARRRPVAQEVVALADRLTRLATTPRALRPLRNVFLGLIARIPAVRRNLAWRLSGLVYRQA